MKKLFTLAAAVLASMSLMAADVTYALTDMTPGEGSYSKTFESSVKAKNNNIFVEVPAQNIKGNVSFVGESNKTDRYLYICDSTGTKTTTGIQMLDAGASISYLPKHIVKKDNKFYLKFNTSHDFKYMSFSYNYEEYTADHSKATVLGITVGGQSLSDFTAEQLSYNVVLEFDATAAPAVTAETGDDATVQITQASAVPGASTVVCTSYDQTASVTYTINFTLESPAPFIRATLTSGSAATVKGDIGGTADVSLSSSFKMDKGKYFGITLAGEETFKEGDSVVISMTNAGQNYPCLFADKNRTNCLFLATETSNELEYTIMLPAAAEGLSSIYLARDGDDATYKWNPVLKAISVYRIADDGQPKLNVNPDSINLAVTAVVPADSAIVTFSGKNLTAGEYGLTIPDLAGLTITPQAVTVGADGKLNAAIKVKFATDATVAAASTSFSLTIGELTKTVKVGYSAVQSKEYMSSINIEQLVLDYGKGYNISAALEAANIDFASIDALDSLNDSKSQRNEPYLGLKLKTGGAYIAGWILAGDTISVKFGAVGCNIKVRINGQEQTFAKEDLANGVLGRRAATEEYLELITTSEKTVVLKQIMVNENIKDVVLPGATKHEVSVALVDHAALAFNNGLKLDSVAVGAEVIITDTIEEGYHFVEWNVYKKGDVNTKVNVNDAKFNMPDYDVVIAAVYAEDEPVVPTLYTVTIDSLTENGAVGVQILGSSMEFEAGTELTLANIPEQGYELDEYIVYKTGEPTTLVTVTDGKFIMPAYDVTVSATFKLIPVVEMFTVTLGSYEHGTVAIIEPNEGNKYEAGAEVRLSVTPDEGYELESISLEGIELAINVENNIASFNMPAQDVTVLATFKQTSGQGFDNIDASMKATKRIINGKLFIEKNGKLYDAQGAMVK